MANYILDGRGGVCAQCGEEKRSLSQHWVKSATCEFRPLDDAQHEIVRGLLLGDGTLGGRRRPSLEVQSTREPHLRWLHRQLGWLSRGITQDGRGVYRLRTMSHGDLSEYESWRPTPPSNWELTPQAARVWYACDGAVGFTSDGARAQITFAASNDEKRTALRRLLSQAGFQSAKWDRRVALNRDETGDWLAWLGDPVPGSEHKWATSRAVYQRLRAERPVWKEGRKYPDESLLNALRNAADDLGTPPSKGDYDRWHPEEYPTGQTIAKRCGNWHDAIKAADLDLVEKLREYGHEGNEYPREMIYAAVREADHVVEGPLTREDYRAWRAMERDRGRMIPSLTAVIRPFGTWQSALDTILDSA